MKENQRSLASRLLCWNNRHPQKIYNYLAFSNGSLR